MVAPAPSYSADKEKAPEVVASGAMKQRSH